MPFPKKIELLDTTLRDGAQAESISFSLQDKLALAKALDSLGVAFIEAGMPGATPKDAEFFKSAQGLKLAAAALVAFGPTMRPGGADAASDAGLAALLAAGTKTVSVVGKTWRLHVSQVLETTPEENLRIVRESVALLAGAGRRVIFDAEHFFDGYRDDPAYALAVCGAAIDSGAEVVCLCETNGGAFPARVSEATAAVARRAAGRCRSGIHSHDDAGRAVANTMAAVEAGATHVQGTLCGFGERCGNANLATLIGNLQVKSGVLCIPPARVASLTRTVRQVASICNIQLPGGAPYVGRRAFAHKGGMHADGVRKVASSFEHVAPESVGNTRRFLVSEMAGRSAVIDRINAILPGMTRDDDGVGRVLARLKDLEKRGWQFEGADGSFAFASEPKAILSTG
ncbi:MAG: citramalate synthase, partial [Kiritimatiellae bacterium]|nr:citramalate synthase [Kiritimatiellia bacterium]